jgi:glycosyltransferase involved in cell wall biosynthesis
MLKVENSSNQIMSTSTLNLDAQANDILQRLDDLQKLTADEIRHYNDRNIDSSVPVPQDFKLSIVIPVYNEQETIATVLTRVAALPVRKEIVIVDDCSTDNTGEILKRLSEINDVVVIRKTKNEGKGAALRTGFQKVTGDVVVVQDADLEYNPSDIPGLMVPILEDSADVVYGSRFLGEETQDESWIHRFGNAMLTKALNFLTGLKLTDMETCYKAFRGDVIRDLNLRQNRFGIEPELTAKLARRGFRFTEVPISYNARGYDEGKKIGVRDLFNALWCIGRYGWSD